MARKRGHKTAASDESLEELVARANDGDHKALALVRKRYDEKPALWKRTGDLARQAKHAWIEAMLPKDELANREVLERKAQSIETDLLGPCSSPMERLLVERIVLCWLQVNFIDAVLAQNKDMMSMRQSEHWQRRLDGAHRRYLSAIKALAQVRRLLRPAVQVNIAQQQVNVSGQGGGIRG